MTKIIQPTLQQMRLFEAVARHRSITRAADEVHLTQPSVSMQVKTLEGKLGLPLTDKIGKTLHITRAGQVVAAASRDVLDRLGDMQRALEDMHREVAGPLSVSAVSTAKYFLPQLLGSFKRRYPGVEPRLQITNRETVLKRIKDNADDLYIMGRSPSEGALVVEPFLENIIVFAARPDNPLVGQKNIPIARLVKENIIQREPGSGTRQAIEKSFLAAGQTISTHMEFDDTEAIKQGVISGLGIAYLSLHSLRLERAAGELEVLDVEGFPLRRRWYAAHQQGKHLSSAAQSFLDFLQQESHREVTKPVME